MGRKGVGIPAGGKGFLSPLGLWVPPSLLLDERFFSEGKAAGACSRPHISIVSKLRMNGAVPLLLIYAFVAWIGTAFCLIYLLGVSVLQAKICLYEQ